MTMALKQKPPKMWRLENW